MKVQGLHHVTAITADIEANVDFYGRLLGLRLVWQGVNADDPEVRHVAYGDERGTPGSVITFFDMPGVPRGRSGAGMVHRLVMRVADARALDFWERRLARGGVVWDRLADRLLFSDPDGLALELVIDDGRDEPLLAYAADVDGHVAIRGMHAVRAYSADPDQSAPLLGDVLGMKSEGERTWRARGDGRHSLLIYDEPPENPGQVGAGTMHHIAFTIRDGDVDRWRDRVADVGLRPTPVLDRKMAKSFYFREPSRVLFELATEKPGFVFEPAASLGESLVLVGDLENRRAELEQRFPLLSNPRGTTTDWAATC
jgi:glyoxalase family protein